MSIQSFSFPVPETRFVQAGHHVYKFKIRGGANCSGEEKIGEDYVNKELEDAIRVVLANLDVLQPFSTAHFNIFPYRSRWERVSKLCFTQSGQLLSAYPYLISLYLEHNAHTHTVKDPECWTPVLSPACSKKKSPLEGGAEQHSLHLHPLGPLAMENLYETKELVVLPPNSKTEDTVPPLLQQWEAETPDDVTQGEMHHGTAQEVTVTPDPAPGLGSAPESRGVLARLASQIFSLFYREKCSTETTEHLLEPGLCVPTGPVLEE